MEYNERTYREHLKKERWSTFTVIYKESDLWIGVDNESYDLEMAVYALSCTKVLRDEMDLYLLRDPGYATALAPYTPAADAPEIFKAMAIAARQAGIGPMSAVAGAVAHRVAMQVKERFHAKEIIVENGGDIYADIREEMDIMVFAGSSPLSGRVGLTVQAAESPLGICTSSGTVGPSLSFGKADAVMIICRDAALADSYATAFGNCIQTKEDIDPCMEKMAQIKEIIAAICIKEDKIGIIGKFDLKIGSPTT